MPLNLFRLLMAVALISGVSTFTYVYWVRVLVDSEILDKDTLSEAIKTNSLVICGALCSSKQSCNIWCHKGDENCILSSIVASPKYVDKSSVPITCYTKKRKDIVVGSKTYSAELGSPYSKSELATDGIYLYDYGYIFRTKVTENPWILIDFRKSATIYEIIIKTNYFPFMCSRVRIVIGDMLITTGNFSSYEKLNSITNPCDNDNEIMYFKPQLSMQGQYVAVYRPNRASFSMLYIEIDGEFN